MTNVNLVATELAQNGGTNNGGYRMGYIDSGAKAAQNDTWTVTNASTVLLVFATVDATGAAEPHTLSTNVVTLTSATATACSAFVIYKA
jgi:hypothetical protein